MNQHMSLLGLIVKDKVTNFEGVVTTVAFDLYGCVQAIVTPVIKDSKLDESRWPDTKRLVILHNLPVMDIPKFEASFEDTKGGATKTLGSTLPMR